MLWCGKGEESAGVRAGYLTRSGDCGCDSGAIFSGSSAWLKVANAPSYSGGSARKQSSRRRNDLAPQLLRTLADRRSRNAATLLQIRTCLALSTHFPCSPLPIPSFPIFLPHTTRHLDFPALAPLLLKWPPSSSLPWPSPPTAPRSTSSPPAPLSSSSPRTPPLSPNAISNSPSAPGLFANAPCRFGTKLSARP